MHLKSFYKKFIQSGQRIVGTGRFPTILHTHQLITVTMTATLAYTLLLAIVYIGRKVFSLKPQSASA